MDTERELTDMKALLGHLATLVVGLPQGEPVKPNPGVNLAAFHQALYDQVHGTPGSGHGDGLYKAWSPEAMAVWTNLGHSEAQAARNAGGPADGYPLWKAARAANIVPDSADGLFMLLLLKGEAAAQESKAIEIAGPVRGPAFFAWFQLYNRTLA